MQEMSHKYNNNQIREKSQYKYLIKHGRKTMNEYFVSNLILEQKYFINS